MVILGGETLEAQLSHERGGLLSAVRVPIKRDVRQTVSLYHVRYHESQPLYFTGRAFARTSQGQHLYFGLPVLEQRDGLVVEAPAVVVCYGDPTDAGISTQDPQLSSDGRGMETVEQVAQCSPRCSHLLLGTTPRPRVLYSSAMEELPC